MTWPEQATSRPRHPPGIYAPRHRKRTWAPFVHCGSGSRGSWAVDPWMASSRALGDTTHRCAAQAGGWRICTTNIHKFRKLRGFNMTKADMVRTEDIGIWPYNVAYSSPQIRRSQAHMELDQWLDRWWGSSCPKVTNDAQRCSHDKGLGQELASIVSDVRSVWSMYLWLIIIVLIFTWLCIYIIYIYIYIHVCRCTIWKINALKL